MATGFPIPSAVGEPAVGSGLKSESTVAEDTLVADQTDHPGEPIAVTAAGAIPWRIGKDGLEVLLIHRPRYDDWSWPKGKIDDGETIPECAIREVEEEIGLKASLGIPLPPIHYHVSAGLKVVHYWAVDVDGATLQPDGKEVDSVMWCAPEKAARLLSNPSDTDPLEFLVAAHARKELDTWPLLVLRHAKAKPRSSWTRAEGDRPLAATGRRQAQAVSRLLHAWKPLRISTSPWLRCIATVAPYAKSVDARVKTFEALTEHKHMRSPQKTAAVVESLFDKQRASLLCTHRPALPTVFKQLGHHMNPSLRALLPSKDPYLAPGELVVCHVARGSRNKIVAVERFKPFDD
jgi:8-oxo-dGTP diphosphatase